ncbi:MAG: tetratricopeptide repeat protein [Firmicutes bacterium]|nr:tetratricopeptide repeat protein [Bacillota bacterium]
MANNVEKYFKEAMDRIVFINLSDEFVDRHQSLRFLKGIPIPVSLDVIEKEARKTESGKMGFSPAAAAQAMTFVIGANKNFPYAEQYKRFLKYNVKGLYLVMLGSGIDMAQSGKYMEAAILFRATDIYDRWVRKDAKLTAPTARDPKLPESPEALYNYARACRDIYMNEEEEDANKKVVFREESVKAFEQLTKEFPEYDQSYYFLGFFYMNKKLYAEAKEVWTKFLALTKEEAMAEDVRERMSQVDDLIIYEKGYLEVMNDRAQNGLDILLPLYEKYKEWWNLLFFIGLGYRKLGEFEKAIFFFEEVSRIKPSQSDAYNELGLCYASLNDYANAEKYFKKAALIEDNDPELLCNLAAVYINCGRLEEAVETLLKAEEMAPGEEITKLWRIELDNARNRTIN